MPDLRKDLVQFALIHMMRTPLVGEQPYRMPMRSDVLIRAHTRRKSSSNFRGNGASRSLFPLPTTRITIRVESMSFTVTATASPIRRPHPYITAKTPRYTGERTAPKSATHCACVNACGRRCFDGARSFFS